jgi:hypothetical protein
MQRQSLQYKRPALRDFAAAGLAGSLAEVLWITAFCAATGRSATGVLRQITATVLNGSADTVWAPAAGIALHFLLGVLIAVAFGVVLRKRDVGSTARFAAALVLLTAIWAMNFFVLLPVLNPSFVTIVPLSASFLSKLLFGVAMAMALDAVPAWLPRSRAFRHILSAGPQKMTG